MNNKHLLVIAAVVTAIAFGTATTASAFGLAALSLVALGVMAVVSGVEAEKVINGPDEAEPSAARLEPSVEAVHPVVAGEARPELIQAN